MYHLLFMTANLLIVGALIKTPAFSQLLQVFETSLPLTVVCWPRSRFLANQL